MSTEGKSILKPRAAHLGTSSRPHRAGAVTLASILVASTLLGFVSTAEAAPGDFTVTASNKAAGASTVYTVTYFVESAVGSNANLSFAFPYDATVNGCEYGQGFILNPSNANAVTHEYSSAAFQWRIYEGQPGGTQLTPAGARATDCSTTTGYDYSWIIEFIFPNGLVANQEFTFDVKARNPLNVGSFPVDLILREPDETLDPAGDDRITATANAEISFAKTGGSAASISVTSNRTGVDDPAPVLKLSPDKATKSIELTVPVDVRVRGDVTTAGWATVQGQTATVDGIYSYTGAKLVPGAASSVTMPRLLLPNYTGTFEFNVLERSTSGAQVRAYNFNFTVGPSIIAVDYNTTAMASDFTFVTKKVELKVKPTIVMAAGDSISFTFPTGFDFTNVGTDDIEFEAVTASATKTVIAETVNKAERKITVDVSGSQTVSNLANSKLIVRDLKTPLLIGTTDAFLITINDDGVLREHDRDLTFNVKARGALSGVSIVGETDGVSGNSFSGQDGTLQIKATSKSEGMASLRVYFPSEFDFGDTQNVTARFHNATLDEEVDPILDVDAGTITIPLILDDTNAGKAIHVSIHDFAYPRSTGSFAFALRSIASTGAELDTGLASLSVTATPLEINDLDREKDKLREVGDLSFTFESFGLVSKGSLVRLAFEGGYNLPNIDQNRSSSGISINGEEVHGTNVSVGASSLTISITNLTEVDDGAVDLVLEGFTNPKIRPNLVDGGKMKLSVIHSTVNIGAGNATLPLLIPADSDPLASWLTPEQIVETNRLIQTKPQTTARDEVRLSWILPKDAPTVKQGQVVPVEGIQIWEKDGKFELIDEFKPADKQFKDSRYIVSNGSIESRYLVTQYYAQEIGRFTGEGNDRPQESDFDGVEVGAYTWTWQWAVIGVGAAGLVGALAWVLWVRFR